MAFSGLPTNALRIMAADMGVVGKFMSMNRVTLPAAEFAQACGIRAQHREDTKAAVADAELVYEVLRVSQDCPLFLRQHVDRLGASLRLSDLGQRYHQHVDSMAGSDPDVALLPKEAALFPGELGQRAHAINAYCCGPEGIDALCSDIVAATRELVDLHPGLEQNVKIFVFLERRLHQQEKLTMVDESLSPSKQVAASAARSSFRWCFSFCAYFIKAFYPPPEMYASGVHFTIISNAHRNQPNAKIVQQSLRDRVAERLRATGAFEALLCHEDGLVPEGSRSNYFLIDAAGVVHMSEDADVLVGITRKAVETVCEQAGIQVVKRKLRKPDVLAAAAVAMTGTSVGVIAVSRIDDVEFDSVNNGVLSTIAQLYERLARANVAHQ